MNPFLRAVERRIVNERKEWMDSVKGSTLPRGVDPESRSVAASGHWAAHRKRMLALARETMDLDADAAAARMGVTKGKVHAWRREVRRGE